MKNNYYVDSVYWNNLDQTYVSHENATEFMTFEEAKAFFDNQCAEGDKATDGFNLWKIIYDDENNIVDYELVEEKYK